MLDSKNQSQQRMDVSPFHCISWLFRNEQENEPSWETPLINFLKAQEAEIAKSHALSGGNSDDGDERAKRAGADLICLRPAEAMEPVLHGTAHLLPNGLLRSMEEEFQGTEFCHEYDYVVHQPAQEGGPTNPDGKSFPGTWQSDFTRDKGHEGWILQDFVDLERAKKAKLSCAEVAALRLYTSPWYATVNKVLRTEKDVSPWATSLSVLISGLLKLSITAPPQPLYRSIKGVLAEGAEIGSSHIDPGVLSCTTNPEVSTIYSGSPSVAAVILCVESTFSARAGYIGDIGQCPDEAEWTFPPLTALEILDIKQHGMKTLVRLRPTLSPMRHYSDNLRYPWSSPNDPLTWEEYDILSEAIEGNSRKSGTKHIRETKFSSNASDLLTGAPKIAALGLGSYMKTSMTLPSNGIDAIMKEFEQYGTDLDKKWFNYIMYEPASKLEDDWGIRDEGRDGMSLESFHNHPNVKIAGLTLAHVLALRLYTCPVYMSLNTPLRKFRRDENGKFIEPLSMEAPHKFPVTIAFIDDGIRKLRAVEAEKLLHDKKSAHEVVLWRGMRNISTPEEFLRFGGVEIAPMSTSYSIETAIQYAMKGDANTIFRIITRSFMDRGADIEFLSTYPKERECLYPPLTFLSPTGRTQRLGSFNVIELVARL
jgi:hypothetical protein